MGYFEVIRRYRKAYRNWYTVLYAVYRGGRTRINTRPKSMSSSLKLDSSTTSILTYFPASSLSPDLLSISFNFKGTDLKFRLRKSLDNFANGDLVSVFLKRDYLWLDPKDEVVVDVGANIGDSAVYFALNGARKIISLEPHPYVYELALENVKANNLGDRIEIVNAGYGKDGAISVSCGETSVGSDLHIQQRGKRIRLYSLKILIEKYNLMEPLIKMDCEGCEVNLLEESDDTLRQFKRMQIEYHYGYEKLKERLERAGFDVNYTQPKRMNVYSVTNTKMIYGYIFATRQE